MLRLALMICVLAGAAAAQDARRPSHCIAIADAAPELQFLHRASYRDPVPEYSVRLHYIDHASFLIQTAGLSIVTDFTGFVGNTTLVPDVVTMNHAHDTHWTANPDPAIPHALPGWGPFGEGIDHHVEIGDVLVRNVSTDIRSQFGGREDRGNSIFVFEAEGLCIGHLGHLHHMPTDAQFAALGRLDVVMAPVDGGYTMPLDDMIAVLTRLKSSVVIPMHWFSSRSLDNFLDGIDEVFLIERRAGPDYAVSLRSLPSTPTVVVLRPEWLRDLP